MVGALLWVPAASSPARCRPLAQGGWSATAAAASAAQGQDLLAEDHLHAGGTSTLMVVPAPAGTRKHTSLPLWGRWGAHGESLPNPPTPSPSPPPFSSSAPGRRSHSTLPQRASSPRHRQPPPALRGEAAGQGARSTAGPPPPRVSPSQRCPHAGTHRAGGGRAAGSPAGPATASASLPSVPSLGGGGRAGACTAEPPHPVWGAGVQDSGIQGAGVEGCGVQCGVLGCRV